MRHHTITTALGGIALLAALAPRLVMAEEAPAAAPVSTPAALAPALAAAEPAATPDADKSPQTAFRLSLGATLAGAGLFAGGFGLVACNFNNNCSDTLGGLGGGMLLSGSLALSAGPSLGHFYAGDTARGLLFTGLRAGVLAGTTVLELAHGFSCIDDQGESDRCGKFAPPVVYAGSALFVGLGVLGALDAIRAPERAAKRKARRAARLSFAPAPLLGPGGDISLGLTASGSF
jgi:hypothetical protein